jgi:hypothetical protein
MSVILAHLSIITKSHRPHNPVGNTGTNRSMEQTQTSGYIRDGIRCLGGGSISLSIGHTRHESYRVNGKIRSQDQ